MFTVEASWGFSSGSGQVFFSVVNVSVERLFSLDSNSHKEEGRRGKKGGKRTESLQKGWQPYSFGGKWPAAGCCRGTSFEGCIGVISRCRDVLFLFLHSIDGG